jgi:HTH-type transcriptional regulator/antitoxin HipB
MRQIVVSPEGLGAVLRELRKKKGITQAALGARVGLDQKRVSLIENGNPNIRVDSLFRLFSALEVGMILEPKALDDKACGNAGQDAGDEW